MKRLRRHRAPLILLILSVNVLVFALSGYSIWISRIEYETRAQVLSENIVGAVDQSIANGIGRIDLALSTLAAGGTVPGDAAPHATRQPETLPLLAHFGRQVSEAEEFLLADADGRITMSSRDDRRSVGQSVADYEFFRGHRAQPAPGLRISKTVAVPERGDPVIVVSRRIDRADGSFGGVVFATIATSRLDRLLAGYNLGKGDVVSLRDMDLELIARFPPADAASRPILQSTVSAELHRLISDGVRSTTYRAVTPADGVDRMLTFRQLKEAPMVVIVGLSRAGYLADWRRAMRATLAKDVGFLLLSSATGLLLVWSVRRVGRESSRRQAAQVALSASEARLQSIFDASPDALLITDGTGAITMANRQVERILGYGVNDLVGRPTDVILPAPARLVLADLHSRLAETPADRQTVLSQEIRALRGDGTECDVEVRVSRVETDHGLFTASAFRDISERKRAEADLKIAAAAFDSQEAVVVTDNAGVVLKVNRAFVETTGYEEYEVVGRTPSLLRSPRQGDDFFRAMWTAIRQAGIWQGEIWNRRKDGSEYLIWLTISAVKNPGGVITHYVGTHYDITERKRAEEKIANLAYFDQLTSLPNRTLLIERLRQATSASGRSGRHGALLFIDLDNFKTLNDSLGHDTGDVLLTQVARRLRASVRTEDTVARLGGDEFLLMLENLSADETDAASQVEAIGDKILSSLNKPYHLNAQPFHCTPSVGVTLFKGMDATIEDLLKQADIAMYRAKAAGRNTLRFFDPGMEAVVMERAVMEADLREALARGQFLLHYQAQVGDAGRLTGAEALVRWQHPRRGMVPPGDFIALAEETGLILTLGDWVLETACRQLADWAPQPDLHDLTVAVNVSARQVRQPDFVDRVRAILDQTGAPARRLKLELTESLLADNMEDMIEKMSALKRHGVGFALDDFGTGYSSLAYLKRLPLDQLKIDRSFVDDVLVDPNDAAIARTIVALARSLGLGVIAEGVETEAQRLFLADAGCHAYQGYLFSKPLAVEAFEDLCRLHAAGARAHG
ncbi:MAG: EAL domain-containing protein [Telmatospirillum sp.]|nr:EAL domain-containing protein [Telmatospirillum sp.]